MIEIGVLFEGLWKLCLVQTSVFGVFSQGPFLKPREWLIISRVLS